MSKLVEFSTPKCFQIDACAVSARKATHLNVTSMFSYSHANTPLGQSECAYLYYLFHKKVYRCAVCKCLWVGETYKRQFKVYRRTEHTHEHASKHWDYKQVKSYEFYAEGYETGHQYQKGLD